MTHPARPVLLPAEWAEQSGIMLTWPHAQSDWADLLSDVEPVFVEMATHIARHETVLINCFDAGHREHVAHCLQRAPIPKGRAWLAVTPSNDTWARDHGPMTVFVGDQPRLLDFRFDGWGGKYPAALDDQITAALHAAGVFGAVARQPLDMVLEGGAIDSAGDGTLLTTTRCLLYGGRNPGLDRNAIEQRLARHLGARRVLWLEHGLLLGDDTDGHVDTLARFCNSATIAYTCCNDTSDPQFQELAAMAEELADLRRADGRPYHLVGLPLPDPIRAPDGARLPATYANFLILNGAVLVPTYADPADQLALERLAHCFPDHEIIGVDCRVLIRQHGSLHCCAMQLPAGVLEGPADAVRVC